MRKPVIGVMGGAEVSTEACTQAERLGKLIAEQGWTLLNGGRNQGIMAASSRGARMAGGFVVGILPDPDDSRASEDLDLAICTNLADGRNVINVLSSDVVIACQGAAGTLSEACFAAKHGKPLILLGLEVGPIFTPFLATGLVKAAQSPEEAIELAASFLST